MEWEVGMKDVVLAYIKSYGVPVIFMHNVGLGCPLAEVNFEWDCFGAIVLVVGVSKNCSDIFSP